MHGQVFGGAGTAHRLELVADSSLVKSASLHIFNIFNRAGIVSRIKLKSWEAKIAHRLELIAHRKGLGP